MRFEKNRLRMTTAAAAAAATVSVLCDLRQSCEGFQSTPPRRVVYCLRGACCAVRVVRSHAPAQRRAITIKYIPGIYQFSRDCQKQSNYTARRSRFLARRIKSFQKMRADHAPSGHAASTPRTPPEASGEASKVRRGQEIVHPKLELIVTKLFHCAKPGLKNKFPSADTTPHHHRTYV